MWCSIILASKTKKYSVRGITSGGLQQPCQGYLSCLPSLQPSLVQFLSLALLFTSTLSLRNSSSKWCQNSPWTFWHICDYYYLITVLILGSRVGLLTTCISIFSSFPLLCLTPLSHKQIFRVSGEAQFVKSKRYHFKQKNTTTTSSTLNCLFLLIILFTAQWCHWTFDHMVGYSKMGLQLSERALNLASLTA